MKEREAKNKEVLRLKTHTGVGILGVKTGFDKVKDDVEMELTDLGVEIFYKGEGSVLVPFPNIIEAHLALPKAQKAIPGV